MSEPVILRKDIPGVLLDGSGDNTWASALNPFGGWSIETINGIEQARWDGYIDLSGYTKQDLTFIPSGGTVVRGGFLDSQKRLVATGALLPSFLMEYIFALQSPMADQLMLDTDGYNVPSFIGSQEQPEQVILGEGNLWSSIGVNQTGGTTDAQQTSITQSVQFGMGDATASDRIYVAWRMILPPTVAGERHTILIPPMAVVLAGITEEEPDLVYIDRLRRAYELQQTPDVD